MVLSIIMKPTYRFIFGPMGPIPLLDTQMMFEEDVIEYFRAHALMDEGIQKEYSESSSDTHMESGSEKMDQHISGRTFEITYENPITGKIEHLHAKTESIETNIQNPIDEAMKTGSTYSVYNYITSPIVTEKVNPYILEEIRKNTEIVPPKPFGGGMIISIKRVSENEKEEIVEVKAGEIRATIKEIDKRGRVVEAAIDEKIVLLQEAVKELKKKKPLNEIISNLPRKARALLFIKLRNKRKVTNEMVELMLLDDIQFLEELKVKLTGLNLKKLVKIAKSIKKLTERKIEKD